MTKRASAAATVLFAFSLSTWSASPAQAASITLDSTNCNSSSGCYGLDWTLIINSGSFLFGGNGYGYEALLQVTDDPLVSGTPSVVISAVDFKASSSVTNAALYTFPTSSSGWSTYASVLNSGGCTGPNAGFVCSETATDPANFAASTISQTWGWYFNTPDPIFTGLIDAHIGAKLTDLSSPGKLLSASYSVPEPGTLTLLFSGLVVAGTFRRRQKLNI